MIEVLVLRVFNFLCSFAGQWRMQLGSNG